MKLSLLRYFDSWISCLNSIVVHLKILFISNGLYMSREKSMIYQMNITPASSRKANKSKKNNPSKCVKTGRESYRAPLNATPFSSSKGNGPHFFHRSIKLMCFCAFLRKAFSSIISQDRLDRLNLCLPDRHTDSRQQANVTRLISKS